MANPTFVPRTFPEAMKLGYSEANFNEDDLTSSQLTSILTIGIVGVRKWHLIAIIQDWNDQNSILAKYTDGTGGYRYVPIPKGQIPPRDIE